MVRDFIPTGIGITTGIGQCAYRCLYCQIALHEPATFGVDRYAAVIDRFLDYKEKTGFNFSQWMGYSFDISAADFFKQIALCKRCGYDQTSFLLGGVRLMADDELKKWYEERLALGCDYVGASYFGHSETHDYWNNQPGQFEFQVRAQKTALSMGMKVGQRLFLLKSTLPMMEELLDILDETSGADASRAAFPLFYSGLARRYDDERVTLEMLDNQPDRVKAVYRSDKPNWKSEKDWITWILDGKDAFKPSFLNLNLSDANIDEIERMSCQEIVDDLTLKTKKAYAPIPDTCELADRYGDRTNEKVYMFLWDMECLWVDRFLEQHPEIRIDRELTYFGR
ncbi:MAG: hypothetical protein LBP22_09470 [Deltaproteobacteria bacterium]|jgi:hypothetical protein|nr:hypothetical protein [Deltaproteobacteria bacterium]